MNQMEHAKVKTLEVYEDKKLGYKAPSLQISVRSHVATTPDRIINQTEIGYLYSTKDHLPKFDYTHKQAVACQKLTPKKLRDIQDGNEFVDFKKSIRRVFNQTSDRIKIFAPKWRFYKKTLSPQQDLLIVGAGAFASADIVGLPIHKINATSDAIASRMGRIRENAERNSYNLTIAPSFNIRTTPRQLTKNIEAVYDAGFKIITIDNGGYQRGWFENYPRYLALSNLDLEGFYIIGTGVPRKWQENNITSQAHLLTLMGQHSLAIEVVESFQPNDEKRANVLERLLDEILRLNANDLGYYPLKEHIRQNGNKIICNSDCPACRSNEGLLDIYRKSNKAGLNSVFNNVHDAFDSLWGMKDLKEGIIAGDLAERLKNRKALQKAVSSINSQTKLK